MIVLILSERYSRTYRFFVMPWKNHNDITQVVVYLLIISNCHRFVLCTCQYSLIKTNAIAKHFSRKTAMANAIDQIPSITTGGATCFTGYVCFCEIYFDFGWNTLLHCVKYLKYISEYFAEVNTPRWYSIYLQDREDGAIGLIRTWHSDFRWNFRIVKIVFFNKSKLS